MTKEELAKIFNETNREIADLFNVSELEKEFSQRFGIPELSVDDAEKISAAIAVVNRMNQEFLFRVLLKVLNNR